MAPEVGRSFAARWPSVASELGIAGILAGGIVGGASHPLLDSMKLRPGLAAAADIEVAL